jgi:hypothetical protein
MRIRLKSSPLATKTSRGIAAARMSWRNTNLPRVGRMKQASDL